MIRCLLKEIECHTLDSNANRCGMILQLHSEIETIYFGGGTPSILQAGEINELLNAICKRYNVSPDAEITLEANPDDISVQKLKYWKRSGINRLSIGIQSFFDRDLKWMNRAHDAAQAEKCLVMAQSAGFHNLSADLIFGIPGLSDDDWFSNIRKLIALDIAHIASYALTVEPKTALYKMIRLHKKEDVNNDHQARQFEMLMTEMARSGYEHYEISNFAKPGFRSRHNSSYWQQKPYLGFGPSAHSFDLTHRYWNVANNITYMDSVEQEQPFFEMETLTNTQRLNEYIMTSLRIREGLDLRYVSQNFSEETSAILKEKLMHITPEWVFISDHRIRLSDAGKLFTDKISADLFF